jgi:hypothetical protein
LNYAEILSEFYASYKTYAKERRSKRSRIL